ncbi:hypothetical protein NLJ89_g10630 [Agrocybe chaxingu]|uniref:Uncharacterized protein n=1 Tax=Agrocybe chaxingu TaxID=84603 RepID=A0A9W8MRY4_9AGAR|nr:hypothetical protein NLJ89_g10630 [Agrocybe chaxingu]
MATAAVTTFNPADIPGFGMPLKETDMDISRLTYNSLPYFEDQPQLQSKYAKEIKALVDIIGRYSMGHLFRVHSAHRHAAIPNGTVRLETDMGMGNGFTWNRATEIKHPDAAKMHATFFKVDQNGLQHSRRVSGRICDVPHHQWA